MAGAKIEIVQDCHCASCATGALDSAAILALIVWYEEAYDFPIKQEEINIDNLGSINVMADFLLARKGG